jgi:Protein of unknown function (DUF1311).
MKIYGYESKRVVKEITLTDWEGYKQTMKWFLTVFAIVTYTISPGARQLDGNEVLYTNLSGLRVDKSGTDYWVTFSSGDRVKLPIPAMENSDWNYVLDEFHSSPNEEWIFAIRRLGSREHASDLFHRTAPARIEMIDNFHERGWENAVKLGLFNKNWSNEGTFWTSFQAWSIDSARGLFSLCGGETKSEMECCEIYFNTRTQKFELTDYLRKVNQTKSEVLTAAEPVDPLPNESELKAKYDALDRQLNKSYAGYIAKLAPQQVASLREVQRGWLKKLVAGEKYYWSFFPQVEKERRRLQFRCDVTVARIEQLQVESPR